MNQLSTISAIMTWGAVITLVMISDGMAMPHNTTEAVTQSANHTASNSSIPATQGLANPIFVSEGEGGNPAGVIPPKNSTSSSNSNRTEKQYYIPYPAAFYPYGGSRTNSAAVADGLYNPFPNYYPAKLGGVTGPGNLASSCAYAYPNRRYSCLGLGRRK